MVNRLARVIVAVDDLEQATLDHERLLGRGVSDPARALFALRNTTLQLVLRETFEAEVAPLEGPGVAALVFEDDGRDEDEWMSLDATRGIPVALVPGESDEEEELPPAPPIAKPDASVAALDHVVVSTTDLVAARKLYGETLGLRLALDRVFEKRGIQILFFRTGGLTVEVVGPLGDGRESDRDRFGGLAWEVADVAAMRERLLGDGFEVSEERPGHKPGTRVCTVKSRTHGVPTLLKGPDLG